ncbi:MAG: ATP-binding protein [Nitrospirota bacterium]
MSEENKFSESDDFIPIVRKLIGTLQDINDKVGGFRLLGVEQTNVFSELNHFISRVRKFFSTLQDIDDKVRGFGIVWGAGLSGVEQTNVFSDKIDSHFSSITIESYKCLRNICIDKLTRINLVAGLNNSGKTSLLEAVYLLARQNDFDGILGVIQRRGKIPEDRIQAEWLLNQIARPISIKGVFDGKQADVTISVIQEGGGSLDMSKYLQSVEITSQFDSHKQESLTRIFKGRERVSQADSIKLLCKTIYSSPFFLNEPQHYSSSYQKSVRAKALPKIFDFIRQEIEPNISDIRLVEDSQRFLVTDSRFDETPDLTSYGEGLQRIFFMSLLFASAQNGILLIDEFENAIHVDLMTRFAPFVYKLALEFNVQVFLTSHSKECIDSFVQNVDKKEDISCYALVPNSEGAIEVRGFDGQEFSTLLRIADVDLRKAQ